MSDARFVRFSRDFNGLFSTFLQQKKVDLLLVDSGDLHDGTGLSDGYPPGGIDAHDVRGLTFPNYKLLKASVLLSFFLLTVESVHQETAL